MVAWIKAVIIAVSAIVGIGSTLILKMKHDNPVEEVCEEVIKDEAGLDVDLTPSSPENKDPKQDNDQDLSGSDSKK